MIVLFWLTAYFSAGILFALFTRAVGWRNVYHQHYSSYFNTAGCNRKNCEQYWYGGHSMKLKWYLAMVPFWPVAAVKWVFILPGVIGNRLFKSAGWLLEAIDRVEF